MAPPTLVELRTRCQARGIVLFDSMTPEQLITLLTPHYDDRSLDAAIEREFLGIEPPTTPMPMRPPRVGGAPRALRSEHACRKKNSKTPLGLLQFFGDD